MRTIESMASTYSQQQRRHAAFVEGSKRSENELVYVVLSPLLIAFALALRITKVSGEIANARRKAAAAAAQPAAASTTVQPLNMPPVTGIAVVPPRRPALSHQVRPGLWRRLLKTHCPRRQQGN